MKALLSMLREAVDSLRRISSVLAAHGLGHGEDGLPRFMVLSDRPRLVDMRGAAFLAGYKSPEMVMRLLDRRGFPMPVMGGNGAEYRWRVSDIDAWVASLDPVERLRGPLARREPAAAEVTQ